MPQKAQVLAETFAVLIIFVAFFFCGGGRINEHSLELRPYPDALEQVWMAKQIAVGRSPLLPIGHEFHPSRYSVVHPFVQAIWISINGGDWRSAHRWSPIAIILGAIVFHLFLTTLHIKPLTRLVITLITTLSPAMIRESQATLQEPTIWLMFALSCLSWQVAMNNGCSRSFNQHLFMFAGMMSGLLICIRPTYVLWPVLLSGQAVYFFGRQNTNRWWTFILGLCASIVTCLLLMRRLTGQWALQHYDHWQYTGDFFALKNILMPRWFSQYPEEAVWQQLGADLIGLRTGLVPWGLAFTWVLLACPVVLFYRNKSKPDLLPVLVLFAIGQVAAHCSYVFYGPRFVIVAFACFVATGCVGWEVLAGRFSWPSQQKRCSAVVLSLLAAVLLTYGTDQRRTTMRKLYAELTGGLETRRETVSNTLATFRTDSCKLKRLHCPIYVCQVNPLFLRLCTDLPTTSVVYQLADGVNAYFDSQMMQLPYTHIKEDGRRLRPYHLSLTRQDPADNTIALRQGLFQLLLSEHGAIAIYVPLWKADEMSLLFAQMTNCGTMVDLSSSGSTWVLFVISMQQNP